jgi:hypothetical protein
MARRRSPVGVRIAPGLVPQIMSDGGGREIEGPSFDIGEQRPRTHPGKAASRREKRVWCGQDGVAGADSQRHEGGELGVRPRTHPDCTPRPAERPHRLFERGHGRPEDELLAFDDLTDPCLDLRAKRRILALEIEQWDRHVVTGSQRQDASADRAQRSKKRADDASPLTRNSAGATLAFTIHTAAATPAASLHGHYPKTFLGRFNACVHVRLRRPLRERNDELRGQRPNRVRAGEAAVH